MAYTRCSVELNRVDLNKLHAFLAVVEGRGVSGAAARLSLTRSAVSQNLSNLEAALQLQLFERVGRRLVITPAGRQLYEGFRSYQGGLQKLLNEIRSERNEATGLLRVGTYFGFTRSRLTACFAAFLEKHPRVQIKLLHAAPGELNEQLQRGRIDLALSIYPHPEGAVVTSTPLYRDELLLVSSPRHHLKKPTLQQILQCPVVDYYPSSVLMKRWLRHHFGARSCDLRIRSFAASADVVRDFVARGLGIAVIPRSVVAEDLRSGRLLQIACGKAPLTDYVWLLELKKAQKTLAYRLLKDEVKKEMSLP